MRGEGRTPRIQLWSENRTGQKNVRRLYTRSSQLTGRPGVEWKPLSRSWITGQSRPGHGGESGRGRNPERVKTRWPANPRGGGGAGVVHGDRVPGFGVGKT